MSYTVEHVYIDLVDGVRIEKPSGPAERLRQRQLHDSHDG
jgi:hypothetical protein